MYFKYLLTVLCQNLITIFRLNIQEKQKTTPQLICFS